MFAVFVDLTYNFCNEVAVMWIFTILDIMTLQTSPASKRNPTIYILKCIAVMLITWSHMDELVPISQICTGGAVGDGLFLFCSGFTLFMGRGGDFFNWYKRRVNRIYPSILAWAVVSCLFFGTDRDIVSIILYGGGTFISAMMVFYTGLYFLRWVGIKRLAWFCGVYVLVLIGAYLMLLGSRDGIFIYHTTETFTFMHYFLCMVLGAVVGANSDRMTPSRFLPSFVCALGTCVIYYAFLYWCDHNEVVRKFQLISVIPMWFVLYFIYRMCSAPELVRLYEKTWVRKPVYWISAISLEVYLVQFVLFTDKYNHLFPVNVIVTFLVIFALSYIVKCLGTLILQTFREENYDWKKIVSL